MRAPSGATRWGRGAGTEGRGGQGPTGRAGRGGAEALLWAPSGAAGLQDGRFLWEEVFGWADRDRRRAADPHTIYAVIEEAGCDLPIVGRARGDIAVSRMHADEVDTDASLVRQLVARQFPQWGHLTVEPVRSAGTDHAIYRLGADMMVRLPRVERATSSLEKELQWLPRLGPLLPLAVPIPLASGVPAEGYPWRWAVYRWLAGETATRDRITDPHQAATSLARFVGALHRIGATGGPPPGADNSFRGERLANRDNATRRALAALQGMVPCGAVTAAWEAALVEPEWDGPGVWVHGDLHETNLLARDGRLSAVIDFGCLAVGDPACDVMTAWAYLAAENRDVFRATLSVDDATWARGRGWALSWALIALPYYKDTNPTLAGMARRTIAEVLADHTQGTGRPAEEAGGVSRG